MKWLKGILDFGAPKLYNWGVKKTVKAEEEIKDIIFRFLDKRNLITNTYNEKLADMVYRQAVRVPAEVDKLLKNIAGSID